MKDEVENQPCSEAFQDAVTDGNGTTNRDCDLCGRVHFSTQDMDRGSYEEGELESLLKREIELPDKYISHDGTIGFGYMGGFQVIYDCPCGWKRIRRYEDFMLDQRHIIARYFDKVAEEAQEKADELKKISKAVK